MPASPIRAAVLIPATDYPEAYDWALENQADALSAAGLEVVAQTWTDPDVGQGVDIVLPLVVWGYHAREAEWHALLDRLEAARVPVVNPIGLLRWNSDKAYLAELAERGIATVPTLAVDALADADLGDARVRFDATELVVKPPVSAGADGTFRLGPNDVVPAEVAGRRMLIQPFQQGIVGQGELSLMIFNGAFSHAVLKRAKPGDFRVQPSLGGTEIHVEAPPEAIELAHRALAAAPAAAIYARVDMIADAGGAWQIMELELIEPALFLHRAPGSAERFGAAIAAAAEQILAQR
ncbi:hypothetical protein [Sphingomonas sp.]|uniref:ATP-grasp domain-containing protein n=1 Tax=Sphingomonas sp. TaxID=28214 RepID=UPI00286CE33C|nr:hypothetical protein [Sphingomonas sp.]